MRNVTHVSFVVLGNDEVTKCLRDIVMMAQYYVIVLNLLLGFGRVLVYSSLILSNRISSNSQITGELQI